MDRFHAGGRQIPVERFEPVNGQMRPAVLVVHGADGLDWPAGPVKYRVFAEQLAEQGYVALLVDYFRSTDTRFADTQTNAMHFGTWVSTIAEAVAYAKAIPNVDAGRIGMVGFSLGAYLSLAAASLDHSISAVIEFFGGIPDHYAQRLRSMPPVLILHGDRDWIVPVSEAKRIEQVLSERGLDFESHIYPGQGHGFRGEALVDSMRRTVEFLRCHVGVVPK